MRHRVAPLIVTLVLLALPPLQAARGAQFSLFYANDVHGEIEPCG